MLKLSHTKGVMAFPKGLYMAAARDLDSLLAEHCTTGQIQAVLRSGKADLDKEGKQDVKISGKDKQEVIANLKFAIAHGRIPPNAAVNLLRESEENGNQHIFYYRARNQTLAKRYRDGKVVGTNLFNSGMRASFPRYDLVPDELTWADFRENGPKGQSHDWIGKLYGLDVVYRLLDRKERNNLLVIRYKKREERTVCVVRWNDPNLLEIRIDRSDNKSAKVIREKLVEIWDMLGDGVKREDFDEWTLTPMFTAMLEAEAENKPLAAAFEMGPTTLCDSQKGGITLTPEVPDEETLFSATERRETVQLVLKYGGTCSQIVTKWLKSQSGGRLPEDLRTTGGNISSNELVIPSKTSASSVDYVTNQLRNFAP
jgi:hypothetical protein